MVGIFHNEWHVGYSRGWLVILSVFFYIIIAQVDGISFARV
jgi:hypothetical protein